MNKRIFWGTAAALFLIWTYLYATTYTINQALTISGLFTASGHTVLEGVTSTGATGTGNIVYATSPTLVTPALGTPTALVCTSCTSLPGAQITGTIGNGQYYGVLKSLYVDAAESSTRTAYGDLATLDTVTFTLAATTTVVVQYGATESTNRINQIAFNVPNIDGSDASVQNNAVVFPVSASTVVPGICVYTTSLASGSHTIKIRHKISDNSASGNATWQARLLVVSASP